jgi:hypothetical protein
MKHDAKNEAVNYFFKLHGKSIDRCHEPTETCHQPAIRAHSIPSSTVLDRLAENGHVIMPCMTLKFPPPAQIEFKPVGKNQATTFTGLCSRHDNDIFRPIDVAFPNLQKNQHLFLLAYRAVIREYHVVLQNAIRFQAAYEKRIEVGLSPGNVPCDSGMFAISHLCNAFECYEYKRHYDDAFLAADWQALQHHVIVFKNQRPSIAVSSMFSLDDIDAPETPRVTLSVFPVGADVAVIFSGTRDDWPFVGVYLHRLLSSESYFQKYQLSKLVLQSCDNFVIAPQYFDSLSQDARDALCTFYVDTIIENAENHEDERLYLF